MAKCLSGHARYSLSIFITNNCSVATINHQLTLHHLTPRAPTCCGRREISHNFGNQNCTVSAPFFVFSRCSFVDSQRLAKKREPPAVPSYRRPPCPITDHRLPVT